MIPHPGAGRQDSLTAALSGGGKKVDVATLTSQTANRATSLAARAKAMARWVWTGQTPAEQARHGRFSGSRWPVDSDNAVHTAFLHERFSGGPNVWRVVQFPAAAQLCVSARRVRFKLVEKRDQNSLHRKGREGTRSRSFR